MLEDIPGQFQPFIELLDIENLNIGSKSLLWQLLNRCLIYETDISKWSIKLWKDIIVHKSPKTASGDMNAGDFPIDESELLVKYV